MTAKISNGDNNVKTKVERLISINLKKNHKFNKHQF